MFFFFFFNDTATTEIYTLSLHDALPIFGSWSSQSLPQGGANTPSPSASTHVPVGWVHTQVRSEEHTSELQSLAYLVCRLLLEKKKRILIRQVRRCRNRHLWTMSTHATTH